MQEEQKYAKKVQWHADVQENNVTRSKNSESNDVAEFRQFYKHRGRSQDGREIFEAIVVSRENDKLITASSTIEGMDEE